MKIGLASAMSVDNDVESNLDEIRNVVSERSKQMDLLCFGEAFLQGFNALTWEHDKDKGIAISMDSNVIETIKLLAKENNVGIGFGFFELDKSTSSIYCSYMVVNHEGGCVHHFRRVSKGWKEAHKTDYHYREGNRFTVFTYQEKRIVLALCGDLWSEENVCKINALEKDFVLWPLHIDYTADQWNNELDDYIEQASKVNAPVLMVNNMSQTSLGGAYCFDNNDIVDSLQLGKNGVLVVDI